MASRRDERFKIEGDPEEALRALLGADAAPARVAIVVAPEHLASVERLASEGPVWVIRTDDSEAEAAKARQSGGDVTTFTAGASPEMSLDAIADDVALHHGPDSAGATAEVIEVLGAPLSDAMRVLFDSNGFGRLEPTPDGFVAYRS